MVVADFDQNRFERDLISKIGKSLYFRHKRMPMVIHPSQKFTKRLKCKLSLSEKSSIQQAKLDSWSADILKIHKVVEFAILMNDASLSALIIPLAGVKTINQLVPVILEKIAALFALHGKSFDVKNQSILFLKRSDRSLIGTMNELKFQMEYDALKTLDNGKSIDWHSIEERLNEMIYTRTDYQRPNELLRKLLS